MTYINDIHGLLASKLGPNKRIVNVNITKPPPKGIGSIMLKIKLTVQDHDGNEELVHLVGKKIPEDQTLRDCFDVQKTFKKEVAFYEVILPMLKDFQREEGVEDVLDNFAEFYAARNNLNGSDEVDDDAIMLLEDLSGKGFINQKTTIGFDLDTSKKILGDLAKFNGVTIAFKMKRPELFESQIKPHCETLPAMEVESIRQELADLENLFSKNPRTSRYAKKATSYLEKHTAPPTEPYATLIHDDLWVNNTMQIMKDNKCVKNIFIDFQLLDYRSCASDVFFFIWTSVNETVLRHHLDELLKHYHDQLIQILKQHNADISGFNYDKFLEELQTVSDYEFGHSLLFVTMLKTSEKFPSNMNDYVLVVDDMSDEVKEFMYFMIEECNKRSWLR